MKRREMKGYDFSAFENVEITGIDMDSLTDEERSILYVQAKYCQDVLNANAYGSRGTYRMKGTHHYEKSDELWILVNR